MARFDSACEDPYTAGQSGGEFCPTDSGDTGQQETSTASGHPKNVPPSLVEYGGGGWTQQEVLDVMNRDIGPSGFPELSLEEQLRIRQFTPRFFEGDQYLPGQQLNPDEIGQLNASMYQAGLLPEISPAELRMWGPASREAYTKLLQYAQDTGLDPMVALDMMIAQGGGAGALDGAGASALSTVVAPNREDLKVLVGETGMNVLGYKPDAGLVENIVDKVIGTVVDEQSGANAAQTAAAQSGATEAVVEQPRSEESPSVTKAVELAFFLSDPEQAAARRFYESGNKLIEALTTARADTSAIGGGSLGRGAFR